MGDMIWEENQRFLINDIKRRQLDFTGKIWINIYQRLNKLVNGWVERHLEKSLKHLPKESKISHQSRFRFNKLSQILKNREVDKRRQYWRTSLFIYVNSCRMGR